MATVYDLEKTFDSVDQTLFDQSMQADKQWFNWSNVSYYEIFLSNRKVSIQVNDYIGMSFVPLNGLPQGAVLSPRLFIFNMKGFLQDGDLTYKYADDSTSLSSKENLSTSLEKAEHYTYKWRQVLNKNKTEHINFSKEVFQSDYKFVERCKMLGLWFEQDLSFKTHAAIISASVVNFWKETSLLIAQGLNPYYAVRIFD